MNTKNGITRWIIICLIFCAVISCTTDSITDDFIEYNSLDDETFGTLLWENAKTAFTMKYPQEWESSWVSDSGVVAFLMASENLDTVWSSQEHDSAFLFMTVMNGFSDDVSAGAPIETLLYRWTEGPEIIEEPSETIINGRTAARGVINTLEGEIWIVTIIIEGHADLLIFASYPTEKESEFRPILEAIIGTIKLESAE